MARPFTHLLSLLLPILGPASASGAPSTPQGGQAAEVDCIDLSRVSARRALSADSIRFEMIGGRAYVNHLPGRCPGLARSENFAALAFEVQGNRLCRGDRVSAVDPALGGFRQAIPCVLGAFTPVPPEKR